MRKLVLCAMAVVLLGQAALADDYFDPWWQGHQDNWVHAEWNTWPGFPGPMAPDTASRGTGEFNTGWDPYASACGEYVSSLDQGRTSVILMDTWKTSDHHSITVTLPNFIEPNPAKDVFIQITYWKEDNNPALPFEIWNVWTGTMVGPPPEPLGEPTMSLVPTPTLTHDHGNGWFTTAYMLHLNPNPTWETVNMVFDRNSTSRYLGVDQVVVDTYCFPEPATLALLACGGVAIVRRRR